MKSRVVGLVFLVFFICISLGGIILYCLSKNDINNVNKDIALIDEEIPYLDIINSKIYIDDETDINVYDNIIYSFGKLGGELSCDTNIKIGKNDISCIAKGNNNLTTTKMFTVYKSKTYNKNAIFFGDSITAGYGSIFNDSWAEYIENNYDLNKCVNAGINDFRVSTFERPNKWLGKEVMDHYNDNYDYDYVILQGGINDALWKTPIGEISEYFDDNFNTDTFYGGLETYIQKVIDKWPNAKIGYIITYYIPNYDDQIYTYDHFKEYYLALKKVLVKYNIPYLDLFAGKNGLEKYSEILQIDTTKYLTDNLHLNDEGYEKIAPYIYNWMQNLNKYEKVY